MKLVTQPRFPSWTPERNRQRTAKFVKRMLIQDRCVECTNKLKGQLGPICFKCLVRKRLYARKRFGNQAWHPGGRGRPPILHPRYKGNKP